MITVHHLTFVVFVGWAAIPEDVESGMRVAREGEDGDPSGEILSGPARFHRPM